MLGNTYAVVTVDGREHPVVDLETIKRWYLQNQLNDESLIFSSEAGDWRPLRSVFDPRTWMGNFSQTTQNPELEQDDGLGLTSLAIPPDADFKTVHHTAPRNINHRVTTEKRNSYPGATALATLVVFGVFGVITYYVMVNFVFYDDTISFSNKKSVTTLKTNVKGTPFSDPSGAKVNFPAGWELVSADMPEAKVQSPDARMFAVNFEKNMYAALEIVPLESGQIDLKRKMSEIWRGYREKSTGPFSGIADRDDMIGSVPARKGIYNRKDNAIDASTTTHILIAQDEKNLFVFQVWAVSENYGSLLKEFDQAEKALILP